MFVVTKIQKIQVLEISQSFLRWSCKYQQLFPLPDERLRFPANPKRKEIIFIKKGDFAEYSITFSDKY